jgi:hypothetical protein
MCLEVGGLPTWKINVYNELYSKALCSKTIFNGFYYQKTWKSPPPKKKGTKVEVRVRRYPGPSKLWHISNFAYTTKYYLNSAKGSGML